MPGRKGNEVPCDVRNGVLINDAGVDVDSTFVTCSRCGKETESFGVTERSVKRCLVMLREGCDKGERNFYVDASGAETFDEKLDNWGDPEPATYV